jgi:hypothetical protein
MIITIQPINLQQPTVRYVDFPPKGDHSGFTAAHVTVEGQYEITIFLPLNGRLEATK